jgi:hypothetical protein
VARAATARLLVGYIHASVRGAARDVCAASICMALFVALPPLSVPFLVSGAVGSPAHVANVPWETAPPRWISEHVLRGGKERLRPPIDTAVAAGRRRPWVWHKSLRPDEGT